MPRRDGPGQFLVSSKRLMVDANKPDCFVLSRQNVHTQRQNVHTTGRSGQQRRDLGTYYWTQHVFCETYFTTRPPFVANKSAISPFLGAIHHP